MTREKKGWRQLAEIFLSFLRIGPVTFGGGYAMIPLIEREVVKRRGWISEREIAEIFAVAESVPGAIAINSAAFIGYRLAGARGAVAALLGIMLPTFLIVLLLCALFLQVRDEPKIAGAFMGIKAAIVALIAYAAYTIGKTAVLDKTTLAAVLCTVALLLILHVHPVPVILAGAVAGIVLVKLRDLAGWKTKLETKEDKNGYEWFMGEGI